MKSSGPLVVAVVLLLCVPVYLVSYFALVVPGGVDAQYRLAPQQAAVLYWPLEEMDRRIRPAAWQMHVVWEVAVQQELLVAPLCNSGAEEMTTEASFFVESDEIGSVWTIPGPGTVSVIDISCTFGADEMTTEASFFEEPDQAVDSFDDNPFDDAP